MMRNQFVSHFSEEIARAIEDAAASHKNGIHDEPGSDPFRWAVLICIGAECFTRPSFATHHGIERADEIKPWLLEHGRRWLSEHDGQFDYIALLAGLFHEYMPPKPERRFRLEE